MDLAREIEGSLDAKELFKLFNKATEAIAVLSDGNNLLRAESRKEAASRVRSNFRRGGVKEPVAPLTLCAALLGTRALTYKDRMDSAMYDALWGPWELIVGDIPPRVTKALEHPDRGVLMKEKAVSRSTWELEQF